VHVRRDALTLQRALELAVRVARPEQDGDVARPGRPGDARLPIANDGRADQPGDLGGNAAGRGRAGGAAAPI
jgi:hypothetical protein